tara:strand:- start:1355 stop:1540 length:186 start_codon:yes stop_codon:yes gene_type:complete
MPIWLRKFTFNKIKQWFDAENESKSKSTRKPNEIDLSNPDKSKIPSRTVNPPNYVTGALKK